MPSALALLSEDSTCANNPPKACPDEYALDTYMLQRCSNPRCSPHGFAGRIRALCAGTGRLPQTGAQARSFCFAGLLVSIGAMQCRIHTKSTWFAEVLKGIAHPVCISTFSHAVYASAYSALQRRPIGPFGFWHPDLGFCTNIVSGKSEGGCAGKLQKDPFCTCSRR